MEKDKSPQMYHWLMYQWSTESAGSPHCWGGCQVHLSRQTPTSLVQGLMIVRSELEPQAFRGPTLSG